MSAARSTSGSFDAASAGRAVPYPSQPESVFVMALFPAQRLSGRWPHIAIVRKSQIAIVRMTCLHVPHTTHRAIDLLPDWKRLQRSSQLRGPRGKKNEGGQS